MPTGESSSLPQAHGLDVARGLRLFGGQAAVYREALQAFVNLYSAGLPSLDAYLDKPTDEHLARVRRDVHAVGGAGATLGATRIEELAHEFEARVRQPAGQAADPAAPLAGLRRELALLVSSLRAQLERA